MLIKQPKVPRIIDVKERAIIINIFLVLEIFDAVTVAMSSEEYVISSKTMFFSDYLRDNLLEYVPITERGKKFIYEMES